MVLTVTDDGPGIPEGERDRVFERFWRGDSARDRDHGGSGIGLTISRALVEAHGGTLTVTSPGPGSGTAFTVELPSRQRAGPEPAGITR